MAESQAMRHVFPQKSREHPPPNEPVSLTIYTDMEMICEGGVGVQIIFMFCFVLFFLHSYHTVSPNIDKHITHILNLRQDVCQQQQQDGDDNAAGGFLSL